MVVPLFDVAVEVIAGPCRRILTNLSNIAAGTNQMVLRAKKKLGVPTCRAIAQRTIAALHCATPQNRGGFTWSYTRLAGAVREMIAPCAFLTFGFLWFHLTVHVPAEYRGVYSTTTL